MKSIPLSMPSLKRSDMKNLNKIIDSGWITRGKYCEILEKNFNKKLKCKNSILVNSATSGIFLSLIALNLKKDDVIITSPNTFISTINSIYNLGLKIIFCDIDIQNGNIDVNKLPSLITNRTKCILVTHYIGYPVNLQKVSRLCKKFNLTLIEDAAASLGSKYKNRYIGSYNKSICIFSFHANKIITSAEGGLITTDNTKIANKLRLLSYCGLTKNAWNKHFKTREIDCVVPGYKSNFTDLQAFLLINQLERLDEIIKKRNLLIDKYERSLKKLFDNNNLKRLTIERGSLRSPYTYTIFVSDGVRKRNSLSKYLKKNGIQIAYHYKPSNHHSFYKDKIENKHLINTNIFYESVISLPLYNNLRKYQIEYICNKVIRFFNKN